MGGPDPQDPIPLDPPLDILYLSIIVDLLGLDYGVIILYQSNPFRQRERIVRCNDFYILMTWRSHW